MPTRVLVVYGAAGDFSDQLARQLATALRGDGVEAQAYQADEVPDLEDYDGVVLEGAREGAGWTVFARDFVRRHASELKTLPAWFLPSRRGPSRLDLSEQTWWAHAIARCLGGQISGEGQRPGAVVHSRRPACVGTPSRTRCRQFLRRRSRTRHNFPVPHR